MHNMKENKNKEFWKSGITMADYTSLMPYIDRASKTYVKYGSNNLFPQEALKMAKESTLQSRILKNKYIFAMGAGLEDWVGDIYTPNLKYTWEEMIEMCMKDYIYLNAFAIQVIMEESGKLAYFHHPIQQIRLGNYNDYNEIERAYICSDWSKASINNIVEIKMWGVEEPLVGERYLMYFKSYETGDDNAYYALPDWWECADWVKADKFSSSYYVNTIGNGFTPSTIITYPNEPTDEAKKAIYDNLEENFVGPTNASNIMVLFGQNDVLPQITSLNASTNPDIYKNAQEEVLSKIISGNGLPSPTLAGISSPSNLGGASNELLQAYTQYMNTIIFNCRKFVLDKFNMLLKLNGYKPVFNILDFSIIADVEGNTKENDDIQKESLDVDSGDAEDVAQDIKKEEIEEKKLEEVINNDENKIE